MCKLRITFSKGENVRYLSHLDLLRTMIRALRRAEIPMKYSEGFNPHPKITFALPLSVGVTSDCEVMQISLEREEGMVEITKRLSKTLPKGLEIIKSQMTNTKIPPVTRAKYRLTIETTDELTINMEEKIKEILRGLELLVDKKTKTKTSTINILEHIYEFNIVEKANNKIIIELTVSAGSEFNLNPLLVIEGLQKAVPEFVVEDINVHRLELMY